MIELLKIVGSAVITAFATIFGMYLKRKWELKDRTDDEKKSVEDKIDDMAERMTALEQKVDSLSAEFNKETSESDLKSRCLQAGLREMLYDRIKYLGRKYISDGEMREEDYKSLRRMWTVYHEDLEGNGFLDSVMEEVSKVKII